MLFHRPTAIGAKTLPNEMDQRILYCDGAECAMWEPEYTEVTDEVELRMEAVISLYKHPDDDKFKPRNVLPRDPDKYHNPATRLVRFVKYEKNGCGECGLKTKESGCFYPS